MANKKIKVIALDTYERNSIKDEILNRIPKKRRKI